MPCRAHASRQDRSHRLPRWRNGPPAAILWTRTSRRWMRSPSGRRTLRAAGRRHLTRRPRSTGVHPDSCLGRRHARLSGPVCSTSQPTAKASHKPNLQRTRHGPGGRVMAGVPEGQSGDMHRGRVPIRRPVRSPALTPATDQIQFWKVRCGRPVSVRCTSTKCVALELVWRQLGIRVRTEDSLARGSDSAHAPVPRASACPCCRARSTSALPYLRPPMSPGCGRFGRALEGRSSLGAHERHLRAPGCRAREGVARRPLLARATAPRVVGCRQPGDCRGAVDDCLLVRSPGCCRSAPACRPHLPRRGRRRGRSDDRRWPDRLRAGPSGCGRLLGSARFPSER